MVEIVTAGEDFEVPCIQVIRIQDGKIVLFRDHTGTQSIPDLPVS